MMTSTTSYMHKTKIWKLPNCCDTLGEQWNDIKIKWKRQFRPDSQRDNEAQRRRSFFLTCWRLRGTELQIYYTTKRFSYVLTNIGNIVFCEFSQCCSCNPEYDAFVGLMLDHACQVLYI
jgi:hypothetical protein